MGKNYDYDYIILGSGPAGRAAAEGLSAAHKSVAIVEKSSFGGAEVNTRDLPFKIHLDFARKLHDFSTSKASGHSSCHFNLPTLIASRNVAISKAKEAYATTLALNHVKYYNGFAHFLDSNSIAVGEEELTAKNFILATGSALKATEISGLTTTDYLTPETALNLTRLPGYIFIIGGGKSGVELAEYFAMLGCAVIIMERASSLLPREDEEVSAAVEDYFVNELGITVVTNSKVVAISSDYSSKIVVFSSGSEEKMVRVDSIVLATGSEPTLDYGLENANVDFKRTGITVNKYFETSEKNIFAIGDCISSRDSSTERSLLEARTLVSNLLHRQKSTADYTRLVREVHIRPAIATVGLNETDCLARDLKYKKEIINLNSISTATGTSGFIKLLKNNSHHLLGATIVTTDSTLAMSKLLNLIIDKTF